MNQDQYCGLKEHQKETSVCVMIDCGYQSRLICKVCNSKQFHSHNQETNSHLLDLDIIIKNQEALKDQSYYYHQKINNIYELYQQINACKSYLDNLENILEKQEENYNKYIENLYSIQIHLYSKEFEVKVDYELAQIINEVNHFQQKNKNKLMNILNKILFNTSKINELIKQQSNETYNNKQLQVVNHRQQLEFVQMSPNNQDLLIGCQQNLYSYNLQQQTYKQICKLRNTKSFAISKDYQLFYFNDDGAVNIYNRNLNKCEQIILQKNRIQFIMVLSKVLAVGYFQMQSQLYIINLKLKKKIFKFEYVDIVDMHYIENQNLLIVAQPSIVDIMMLNSKFKSQTLEYNNSSIVNIQFDQQNQQLIILDTNGVLTFWTLNKNGKFIKNLNQIKIKYSEFRYFRYNQNLQQYIVFAAFEIIFYDIQGKQLYNLNHSYEDISKIINQNQCFKKLFQIIVVNRFFSEHIILQHYQGVRSDYYKIKIKDICYQNFFKLFKSKLHKEISMGEPILQINKRIS